MTTSGGNWKELCVAATENDVSLTKYHLDMGVDPNYQHPEFMTTPLVEAARVGNLEVVQLLLNYKADPTIVADWEQCTPMEEALKEKHHDVVDILLKVVPANYESECLTIWMTGTYHRDLVVYFLTMGHAVLITVESDEELESVTAMAETLRAETGNKKLWVPTFSTLPDFFVESDADTWHPTAVDVWLRKPTNTEAVVTELSSTWNPNSNSEWRVPFRGNRPKVLFLLESKSFVGQQSKSIQEQLAWLLTNDKITCCAVLEPSAWWDSMTYAFWYQTWCESVLHLLTSMATNGSGAGKAYTYNRQSLVLPTVDKIDDDLLKEWKLELGALTAKL